MKQKVDDMIPDNVIPVPGGPDPDLVVDGVSGHEERAVHPGLWVAAEGRGIGKKVRQVGDLPDINVLLDVVKVVVVPVGGEAVGVKEPDGDRYEQDSEKHRSFFVSFPDG